MQTIEFKFGVGDVVKIIEIDTTATVRGSKVMDGVLLHYVVFWIDGKRCDEWVYESEIK